MTEGFRVQRPERFPASACAVDLRKVIKELYMA